MMSEIGLDIEDIVNGPKVYSGKDVALLGDDKVSEIAASVAAELAKHPSTMIGFSEKDLIESINEGRATCVLDERGKPAAFAQYWKYKVDHTGDGHLAELTVYEIGSWLRFPGENRNGEARKVFEACLREGEKEHPSAAFIAIVEEGNPAAKILGRKREEGGLGGVEIGTKISKQVVRQDANPARMKIFWMNQNKKPQDGREDRFVDLNKGKIPRFKESVFRKP